MRLHNHLRHPSACLKMATTALIMMTVALAFIILPSPAEAQSADATLSALTVSPKDIIGYRSNQVLYHVGVANTVTEATVAATVNDSGASVVITPADADSTVDGHQVTLSEGSNRVNFRVTAENGSSRKTYTVAINRGVTTDYGWKASDDLDGLIAAENRDPGGVWSDGTTFWVADLSDHKIYAYHADGSRNSGQDFDTLEAAGITTPFGIWSDHTTMWVADEQDNKIYAFNMSTKARDAGREFNTLADAGNANPGDIWSDGTTVWVTDLVDLKIYAYNMSTKARDASREFDTLEAVGNEHPDGIWSDHITMWVSDPVDDRIYAYNMSTKAHDTSKEFVSVAAANGLPGQLWSDRETMWVIDQGPPAKAYSYNMPTLPASVDASLRALTVSPKDVIDFTPEDTEYDVGVASDVMKATVAATANSPDATVAITPADSDSVAPGHQVSLSQGRNQATITVTAENTNTTKTYTVNISRGSTDDLSWKASDDLYHLHRSGNRDPAGVWSDGSTFWVLDAVNKKIYAYHADGTRHASEDFNNLRAANNDNPYGIWSDDSTMWVSDFGSNKIYAYNMSTKARDSTKDFNTLSAAENIEPRGIWSDEVTMWVVDTDGDFDLDIEDKIYAYNMSTKARDSGKDFNTLSAAENNYPTGIWSDEVTMWVADDNNQQVYAYNMSTKARDSAKDFDEAALGNAENYYPSGLWSDGATMWIADPGEDKVFSYNMLAPSDDATLSALTVSPPGHHRVQRRPHHLPGRRGRHRDRSHDRGHGQRVRRQRRHHPGRRQQRDRRPPGGAIRGPEHGQRKCHRRGYDHH